MLIVGKNYELVIDLHTLKKNISTWKKINSMKICLKKIMIKWILIHILQLIKQCWICKKPKIPAAFLFKNIHCTFYIT